MTVNLRVGQGYDVHKLVEGRKLILGGVEIPHDKGLLGHSDADVLLHAITDAVLGAAALGDIGKHFPDADDKYKGADSEWLLAEAMQKVHDKGYKLINLDSTVIAQKPKLSPYINEICMNLANILRIDADCVNVKAKTNEKLGFEGQELGVVAQAVVLLEKA